MANRDRPSPQGSGVKPALAERAPRRIREARGNQVPIVAITGWGQEDDRNRARDAGFNHHFTKPVDFEMLLDLIDRGAPRVAA